MVRSCSLLGSATMSLLYLWPHCSYGHLHCRRCRRSGGTRRQRGALLAVVVIVVVAAVAAAVDVRGQEYVVRSHDTDDKPWHLQQKPRILLAVGFLSPWTRRGVKC